MNILKEDLNILSITQLMELKIGIEATLREKRRELLPVFQINVEACSVLKYGNPYVARLYWDSQYNRIRMKYFESSREYGEKIIYGTFEIQARSGDILEKSRRTSSKFEYEWYLVTEMGEMLPVANFDSYARKVIIKMFLQGKLSQPEMMFQLDDL